MAFASSAVSRELPAAVLAEDPLDDLPVSLMVEIRRLAFWDEDEEFFIAETVPVPGEDLRATLPEPYADYAGTLSSQVVIKGNSRFFASGDHVGQTIRVRGDWIMDPGRGLRFQAIAIEDLVPTSLAGLRKYLSSGKIKWVGPAVANAMLDRWGTDVLSHLSVPADLSSLPGISAKKASEIAEAWKRRERDFEVVSFFGQYGIGEVIALRVADSLGEHEVIARVRNSPYMVLGVDGVGFLRADAMARALGVSLDDPRRIDAALGHVLSERIVQQGNTAVPVEEWRRESMAYLGLTDEQVREACDRIVSSGKVAQIRRLPVPLPDGSGFSEPVDCVSPVPVLSGERRIAERLALAIGMDLRPDVLSQVHANSVLFSVSRGLDPSQVAAASMLLTRPVSIMTGGPGTGKTTTLRRVVLAFGRLGKKVVLAAPTGRAAKRMSEAIGEQASTVHMALKYNPGKGGFGFTHFNRMSGDVFILDEASMVDSALLCAWLSAIPDNAQIILVGDVDQLASVGPGETLRDLIESGSVPVSRLSVIHRQVSGSGISRAARSVLNGFAPVRPEDQAVDYRFVNCQSNEEILAGLDSEVRRYLSDGVPAQDIQILCPQKGGAIGVNELNAHFRWILNPLAPSRSRRDAAPQTSRGWFVGERLMQTKNNYDLEVYNGDMGVIMSIAPDESVVLRMDDGRMVEYPKVQQSSLIPGYAITVHKSQGGERPVVLVVVSPSHTFSLNRNLLYTAITRGKGAVVAVGSSRTFNIAVRKLGLRRLTGLRQEIEVALGMDPPHADWEQAVEDPDRLSLPGLPPVDLLDSGFD